MTEHALDGDQRRVAIEAALGRLNERERLIVQERWLTGDVARPGARPSGSGLR